MIICRISAAQPDAGPGWIRLEEVEYGSGTQGEVGLHCRYTCQQCADAPCIKPEFDGAVYRRADGIVIIDPVKAKGRTRRSSLRVPMAPFRGTKPGNWRRSALCART